MGFIVIKIFIESILRSDNAIWISRDGSRLAFLKFNDKKVWSKSFKKIDSADDRADSLRYAKVRKCECGRGEGVLLMKYTQTGGEIPDVSLHVFNFITRKLTLINPPGSLGSR